MSRFSIWLSAALVVACGDDPSNGAGVGASDAGAADVAPSDAHGRPDVSASTDAGLSDALADAELGDGGAFVPGAPPTGHEALEIFAAKTESSLAAQSPVRQGDLLYWECGIQAVGIGHIWGSFRLTTPELEGLSPAQEAEIEAGTRLQLVAEDGAIIARNGGLLFALDFGTPGVLSVAGDGAIQMELNRDVVGQTTRPSNVDQTLLRYRVTVPIPGGTTFVREAWVDTLVPPSQSGC